MEVILLEKIAKLGAIGDVVQVARGYARNCLLPKNKALLATEDNKQVFEAKRQELLKEQEKRVIAAQARLKTLLPLQLKIAVLITEEGKLYGSIGATEITNVVVEAGGNLDKSEIILADGPIRELGEHKVTIHLESEVEGELNLTVVAKGAE